MQRMVVQPSNLMNIHNHLGNVSEILVAVYIQLTHYFFSLGSILTDKIKQNKVISTVI